MAMADVAGTSASVEVPHRFSMRVYWEDTDAAGIVYYANYLRFIERARSELVRRAGIDQRRLQADDGIVFAVRRCEIDYLAPATLGDTLDVATDVVGVGAATVDLQQTVSRHPTVLARAHVRLACVGRNGRPTRLPAAVRDAFATLFSANQKG